MKLLYIIVNDGFSDEVLDLLDKSGAGRATIIPARGWSGKAVFPAVPAEPAKEIVISVVSDAVGTDIAYKINLAGYLRFAANGMAISMDIADVNSLKKFVKDGESEEEKV